MENQKDISHPRKHLGHPLTCELSENCPNSTAARLLRRKIVTSGAGIKTANRTRSLIQSLSPAGTARFVGLSYTEQHRDLFRLFSASANNSGMTLL